MYVCVYYVAFLTINFILAEKHQVSHGGCLYSKLLVVLDPMCLMILIKNYVVYYMGMDADFTLTEFTRILYILVEIEMTNACL